MRAAMKKKGRYWRYAVFQLFPFQPHSFTHSKGIVRLRVILIPKQNIFLANQNLLLSSLGEGEPMAQNDLARVPGNVFKKTKGLIYTSSLAPAERPSGSSEERSPS